MPQPILYVIAGPNGAGKSSVYLSRIQSMTDAEFVNADNLARDYFGKVATTAEESEWGQVAAQERRNTLIAAGLPLVVESTFSHPSKLELLHRAKRQGYGVIVFHVSLASPDLAVARVALRVRQHGHPVPEEKVRARYERNQEIIKAAVLMANYALVLDNSLKLRVPRPVFEFTEGLGRRLPPIPLWAERVYGNLVA